MPQRELDAVLRKHGPFAIIAVALSGGGDSVALLHLASALAKKRKYSLLAFHINHGLRNEAEQEAQFCHKLCEKMAIGFFQENLDPNLFEGNLHDAARKARYNALNKMALENGANIVLTAHTLDDQVETVIQRIIRGTGPAGLVGIAERKDIFLRPLLKVRREQLRQYLQANCLNWCEDPSNVNFKYLRTNIREKLLPALIDIGGGQVLDAIGRLSELAARQRQVLDEVSSVDLDFCRSGDEIDIQKAKSLSVGRRALMLRRWLHDRDIIPSMQVIEDLDHMLTANRPAGPYRLPGGQTIYCGYNTLNWNDPSVVESPWLAFPADQVVDRYFADGRLHLTVGRENRQNDQKFSISRLNFSGCQWCPAWPGARVGVMGMEGNVKCQDLFTNAKVPKSLRKHWPLLVRGEEVLLVAGLRKSRHIETSTKGDEVWYVYLEW